MKMFLWEGESTHVLITKESITQGKTYLKKTKSMVIDKINAEFQCLL